MSSPETRPTDADFCAWFDNHFLDPDGGSSHLPHWLKDDLKLAWDAALSSIPAQGSDREALLNLVIEKQALALMQIRTGSANPIQVARQVMDECAALSGNAGAVEADDTWSAIHEALKLANVEYSSFSSGGKNIFGDRKSIQAAAEAFHSHSIVPELKTQIRHWREECGKLHAKPAAPPATQGEKRSSKSTRIVAIRSG